MWLRYQTWHITFVFDNNNSHLGLGLKKQASLCMLAGTESKIRIPFSGSL